MKTKMFKSNWLPIIVLITILSILLSCQKEPTASFTVSSTTVNVGEGISFTNTSMDADSYEWDFGDGNKTSTESPTRTYNSRDLYSYFVCLFRKWKKILV